MQDIEENEGEFFFPPCNSCKHFNKFSDPPSCAAFRVIPNAILTGLKKHDKPVKGDNGITWEAE